MGAITWDRLRALAGFRAQKGCATSFFLGFDPEGNVFGVIHERESP